MVTEDVSRRVSSIAKVIVVLIGIVIIVVLIPHIMKPNRVRAFHRAFDRSVEECTSDRSTGYVSYACHAADACDHAHEKMAVESYCLKLLRKGDGSRNSMEQLVAFYVLESRPAISEETVLELQRIDESRRSVSDRLDGVHYILKKFASAE